MKNNVVRAIIEMGFVVFLFYSNLLMGEFVGSGIGQERGLAWAILNIFTWSNFIIAVIASFMGYIVFEFLRNKF
jgi:hypothetical protein